MPRYAVAFEIVVRRLNGRPVGTEPPTEAGTAPFPEWFDPDRGRRPKALPNDEAYSLIETYVDPGTLGSMGFDEATIEELRELFETFERGGRRFVPLVPVYAATADAAGERRALTFP